MAQMTQYFTLPHRLRRTQILDYVGVTWAKLEFVVQWSPPGLCLPDSAGLSPVESTRLRWNPVDSSGLWWNPVDSSRLRWNPVDSGALWNPVDSSGLQWNSADSGGIRWTPVESSCA